MDLLKLTFSQSKMCLKSIQVVVSTVGLFSLILCHGIYVPYSLFNHSSIVQYLNCFLFGAVMIKTAKNIHLQVFKILFIYVCVLVGGSDAKESTCKVRDLGSIPGLGRSPRRGHDNSLQYSYLENTHGRRSLVSYSPWGCKELDTTKRDGYCVLVVLVLPCCALSFL